MFAKMSVQKPYTVAVGIILVLVLGVISFMNMTTDLLPSMNLPYIVVYTTYVGASPETVENEVTRPLEAAMATVGDLKNITSTSADNVSTITLEFNNGASMDTAMLELSAKIDSVAPSFPDGVGTPTMVKINPDMLPVVVAAVDMEGSDIIALSEYVDGTLINELEGIDGVASVSASGLIEEEITVSIEQELIDQVNSIILKEVDEELYEVEQELIDGEKQLNEAKSRLAKEGKAGLQQIDDALTQIQQGQTQMPQMIAQLQQQKQQLQQQLEQTQAAIPQLEAALDAMGDISMGEQEQQMLEQLESRLAQLRQEKEAAQEQLDQVNQQLAGATPTPAPTVTPEPTPQPTAKPRTTPRPIKEQEDALAALVGGATPTPAPTAGGDEGEESHGGQATAAPSPKPSPAPSSAAIGDIEQIEESAKWLGASVAYAAEVDADLEELEAEKARLEAQIAQLEEQIRQIESSSSYQSLTQLSQAAAQKQQLESQLAQAQAAIPQLEAGIQQMDQAAAKLEQGIVPGGYIEGIDEDTDLAQAEEQLIQTRAQVKTQLSKAESQIEAAQKELGEARKEFEEKREEAFEEADLDGVITVTMIGQIIGAQNLSMPAGYLTEDGQDYLVRVGEEFQSVEELADTILFTLDLDSLKEVRLKDVATVEITNNADTVYAKVNGNDGIMLSFQKQATFSTAQVADNILAKFEELHGRVTGLRFTPLLDQGVYIDMVIDSVLSNLMSGAVLAVLVLLLFLGDYRPTLIIALSIPTSVVVAFVVMYFTGITLNVMSLAGLALGVGMLVDNSIVVLENIYRLHNERVPILRACVTGTTQMGGAIFSSTLTTVCVFLPLVFITGIARELFTDMGLTITYSLMASLVVAMTVVPVLAAKVLRRQKPRKHRLFGAFLRGYDKVLASVLKFKLPVLVLTVALLAYSLNYAASMGTAFIPEVDSTQMTATLNTPLDATFEEKTALADQVLQELLQVEEVETIGVFDSGGAMSTITTAGAGSISYYIQLKEDKARRNTDIALEIQDRMREMGVDLSVKTNNMDITTLYGSGISVEVRGPELDQLRAYATDIAQKLAQIEGTVDVSDGQEETVPEVTLTVDKEKAIAKNLTVAQIYQYVAMLVSDGVEVSTMTADGKSYAVMAVDNENLNLTREELADKTIEVEKTDGTIIQVRLGDVCDISETLSLSSINRTQQQYVVAASCGVDEDHNVGLINREVEELAASYPLEEGYSITITGEGDTIASTLGDLITMIALAVVLIYLIMVAQFQSFLMPFIVLFTIPLAITGGLLVLIFTGIELSMVAMLGFLILAGVIVNNGIVFVETVNQLREEGMEKRQALRQAGQLRMRPILMTALTTILGMSTMALGSGMGAELMQPLALVTIGGLTYGTLLTMFVVPVLYDLFTRKTYKVRRIESFQQENQNQEGRQAAPAQSGTAPTEAQNPSGQDMDPPQSQEDLDAEYAAFVAGVEDEEDNPPAQSPD